MSIASKQDVAVTTATTEKKTLATPVAANPFDEMERLFERMMPRGWLRPYHWDWPLAGEVAGRMSQRIPAVDVLDEDGSVLVRVELPGIDKKDIAVTATDHTLTIRTQMQRERREDRCEYYSCEILRGAAARTIQLPCSIDPDNVKANLRNGILEITLTKTAGTRRHQVTVE